MAEKVANYTQEQTAMLVEGYQAGTSVEQLAESFGKSVRSIVAKLSREGVYQKKEYVTKTGETPVKKDEHADFIGKSLSLSEADTESLTKANKRALAAVAEFIRKVAG
jgi:hypothetical protein